MPLGGSPDEAIAALASQRAPFLIGVRHHSPAMSVAMPSLLADSAPDVLAIELPAEAADWLEWVAHPAAEAPLAMAFGHETGQRFYPFADFSPELVALRWARANGVRVACIDLPINAAIAPAEAADEGGSEPMVKWRSVLAGAARDADPNEVWDRLVEAPAPGCTPEQVRVAGLAHGWSSRADEPNPDPETLAREQQMRSMIATETSAGHRVTAVIGAFHAPALAAGLVAESPPPLPAGTDVPGCLVRYSFAELDSRSGYPAGIRDPGWQQLVLEAGGDADEIVASATAALTRVSRELRAAGHPSGPAETAETLRLAIDLARIRGLPAPGRRELIEAATTVLAHGEVLGRGRAVAAALSATLIGRRLGRVAPGTPVSALLAELRAELRAAQLPTEAEREVALAPLRGGLDLTRHVLLRRLQVAAISYGQPATKAQVRGADRITQRWVLGWTPATEASIELASTGGLDSAQIARTKLLTRPIEPDDVEALLYDAADCAIPAGLERAFELLIPLIPTCGFAAAVRLSSALADVATARIPGAALLASDMRERADELSRELDAAVIREIDGIAASADFEDAIALAGFVGQGNERRLSLEHALKHLAAHGSPLMQGAVAGLRIGHEGAGELIASWLQLPDPRILRLRLAGLLITSGASLESSPVLGELIERVNTLPDATFVARLPALRGGFDPLVPDAKSGLLDELSRRYGPASDLVLSAEESIAAAEYDQAAADRLAQLGLADARFSPAERWRLVLGTQTQNTSNTGRRMAAALDELYGSEGAEALDEGRRGAGRGPAQLGVRRWKDEIESLFGADGVNEIFAEAANRGRGDVLAQLDPNQVRPSVELLTTALSLTGALPEARLAQLRPLVARLVRELAAELAIRIRPALTGLATPRPTRQRTSRIDLPRTIRANLRHVVPGPQIVPVTPVFRQLGNKEVDWEIIIVVDVSGSMSQSVVFAALTSAILAGVPSLKVTFLAFSTEVIDFSDRVADPLSLLLEVDIGGGTDIGKALRVARTKVRVPTRTLCAVISDFEEGGSVVPLLAEVEALATSGVSLLGCAALDDSGAACYNAGTAAQVAAAGMRVAAVSPLQLAQWVRQVVRG